MGSLLTNQFCGVYLGGGVGDRDNRMTSSIVKMSGNIFHYLDTHSLLAFPHLPPLVFSHDQNYMEEFALFPLCSLNHRKYTLLDFCIKKIRKISKYAFKRGVP